MILPHKLHVSSLLSHDEAGRTQRLVGLLRPRFSLAQSSTNLRLHVSEDLAAPTTIEAQRLFRVR